MADQTTRDYDARFGAVLQKIYLKLNRGKELGAIADASIADALGRRKGIAPLSKDIRACKYIRTRITQIRSMRSDEEIAEISKANEKPNGPIVATRNVRGLAARHSPLRRVPYTPCVPPGYSLASASSAGHSSAQQVSPVNFLLRRMWFRNVVGHKWALAAARCAKGLGSIIPVNGVLAKKVYTMSIRGAVWGRSISQLLAWGQRAKRNLRNRAIVAVLFYLRTKSELRRRCDTVGDYMRRVRLCQAQYRAHHITRGARLALLSYQWLKVECGRLRCRNMALAAASTNFTTTHTRQTRASCVSEMERALRDRVAWCPAKGTSLRDRENALQTVVDKCVRQRARALIQYENNVVFYARQKESKLRPQPPLRFLTLGPEEMKALVSGAHGCVPLSTIAETLTPKRNLTLASSTGTYTPEVISFPLRRSLPLAVASVSPAETAKDATLRRMDEINARSAGYEREMSAKAATVAVEHADFTWHGGTPWRQVVKHVPRPPPEYRSAMSAKMVKATPMGTWREMHELYLDVQRSEANKFATIALPRRPSSAPRPLPTAELLKVSTLPVAVTLVRQRHGSARTRRLV